MRRKRTVLCMTAALAFTLIAFPSPARALAAAEKNTVAVWDSGTDRTFTHETSAQTVGAALAEMQIEINAKDICEPDPAAFVEGGMEIRIQRALEVVVHLNGIREKRQVRYGTTAGDLVETLQEEWAASLLCEGDPRRVLSDREVLELTAWESAVLVETETVPYETYEIKTTALSQGHTQVRQPGAEGVLERTVEVIWVDGLVAERKVLDEMIAVQPVAEVIETGIGGELGTLTDVTLPGFSYIEKITMSASAFTSGYESTGKQPGDAGYGLTCTGEPVRLGIVSVDPEVIPLGTKLYVEGYGYSLAADTGSGIDGNKIDLYFNSLEDALQFGRRDLDVYILEEIVETR